MKQQNFIYTSDKDTAAQLIALGFEQLPMKGNIYGFINKGQDMTTVFEAGEVDTSKIKPSNKLFM